LKTGKVRSDKQRIFVFGWMAGSIVESCLVSTLHRPIETNTPKICNLSIIPHQLILSPFLMTPQRHFSFSISEEMDGLMDFLFIRSFFLGIRPLKNTKNHRLKF